MTGGGIIEAHNRGLVAVSQRSLTPHSPQGGNRATGGKGANMEAPGATLQDGIAQQADFVAELVRQRMLARLSQAALGALMGYDRTYVNKIERGALEPTAEFARKADASLHLSGDLFGRWESFNASKRQHAAQARRSPRPPAEDAAADLVIAQDEAWLRFDGETYGLHMR